MSVIAEHEQDRREEAFAAWLSKYPLVRVAVSRRGERWYALATEFNIAGMGPTKVAALQDLFGLLDVYLRTCFADGRSIHEAMRPVPFGLRVWIRINSAVARVFRQLAPAPVQRSGRVFLPELTRPEAPTAA